CLILNVCQCACCPFFRISIIRSISSRSFRFSSSSSHNSATCALCAARSSAYSCWMRSSSSSITPTASNTVNCGNESLFPSCHSRISAIFFSRSIAFIFILLCFPKWNFQNNLYLSAEKENPPYDHNNRPHNDVFEYFSHGFKVHWLHPPHPSPPAERLCIGQQVMRGRNQTSQHIHPCYA